MPYAGHASRHSFLMSHTSQEDCRSLSSSTHRRLLNQRSQMACPIQHKLPTAQRPMTNRRSQRGCPMQDRSSKNPLSDVPYIRRSLQMLSSSRHRWLLHQISQTVCVENWLAVGRIVNLHTNRRQNGNTHAICHERFRDLSVHYFVRYCHAKCVCRSRVSVTGWQAGP